VRKRKFIALAAAAAFTSPVLYAAVYPHAVYAAYPTLREGDTGPYVVTLQKDLNAAGIRCTVDGVFGPATQAAVIAFQKAHHLTADGIVGPATWNALTAISTKSGTLSSTASSTTKVMSAKVLRRTQISLNGKVIAAPMAFTWNGTTYMPIWYVGQALQSLSIQSQWNGTRWNLVTPPGMPVNLANISAGTGHIAIALNGTTVQRVDGLVYPDPDSHVNTTYLPIWYVMQALGRIGVKSEWDGTTWNLTYTQSITFYSAFAKSGEKLGDYATLQSAEAALANHPGGYVKDATGQVVFREADYEVFANPAQAPAEYTDLNQAKAAVRNTSNGYIVDGNTHTVVQMPRDYYVYNGSSFTSPTLGWSGTVVPSFAKPGYTYYPMDVNPGHSPYYTKFYTLATPDGHYVGTYAGIFENPFRTVDLRSYAPSSVTASQIDAWLAKNGSPLQGLGEAFIEAQKLYGVNAVYLVAHAIEETGWGKYIPVLSGPNYSISKNNLFGYGAYDSNPNYFAGTFPSDAYSILYEAYAVRTKYLEPSGSFYYKWPTLDGMNENYATSKTWAISIAAIMNQYASQNSQSLAQYTQYQPSNPAPSEPETTGAPVFYLNGATGTVMANPYQNTKLGGLPVFASPSAGFYTMFPGTLKYGSSGYAVKLLQRGLGITADGIFGQQTQNAVKSFQSAHGLPATGVCDVTTWNTLFPAPSTVIKANTPVRIDQMEQGLVADHVTEWYHVTAGSVSGWVDSQYVQLNNVYAVQPTSGYNVSVYGSEGGSAIDTFHSGDYVVAASNTPDAAGYIRVQWVNWKNHQTMTGYLKASAANLVKVPAPPAYTGN
jgi:peptidoglycan hydrolase-like protein with peptidoglycan-binding domain